MGRRAGEITAIVLCGGGGRRMGGLDKPLIELDSQPIIERVLDALARECASVVISANRNLETYARYGKVVTDQRPDRGPLEGIACCLSEVTTPWAFVCPGDGPFIHAEIPRLLHQSLQEGSAQLALAHDGQRLQHLHVMLSPSLKQSINDYLDTGHRSVHGWLQSQDFNEVLMADHANAFRDLDQPEDLN